MTNTITAQYANIELNIQVAGLKNDRGQLIFDVYDKASDFLDEKPLQSYYLDKTDLKNGYLYCTIHLKEGTYGIAMIDDEDKNGQLKRNFIGYPLEGFGFSNMPSYFLRRPKFVEFSFSLNKNNNVILIEANYSPFYK